MVSPKIAAGVALALGLLRATVVAQHVVERTASAPPTSSNWSADSASVAYSDGYSQGHGHADHPGHAGAAGCSSAYASECEPYCSSTNCGPVVSWSASVGGLFLDRDDENAYPFSFNEANEDRQHLFSRDAGFDLAPGFEARLIRYDCCSQSAVEFVYWQLFPSDEQAYAYGSDLGGNLSAILNYNQLDYNGATADNYTNLAFAHRLVREMDVYNIEVNRVTLLNSGCDCGYSFTSQFGLRFFKFDESLQFASDPNDGAFTGETDELYYDIDLENNLAGFQLGGFGEYRLTPRLGLVCGAKAGLFGNFIDGYSRIGGTAGTAVINNGPNGGARWLVDNDKEDIAMLAEVILGAQYQIGCHWRISADYRVIGVSGVALPTNQIYHDLRGLGDVERLSSNGSLILHGAFLRAERCF
jgi:hypothetical protein